MVVVMMTRIMMIATESISRTLMIWQTLFQELSVYELIYSSQFYVRERIIMLILKMKKPRYSDGMGNNDEGSKRTKQVQQLHPDKLSPDFKHLT